MKLFQQLLVAPAALGLLAPMAANAAELNINGVSNYSASSEEVKSISQFSDVYPTDWAYQALTNLAERHGCAAASPSGSMTRYEAAALLNTCLGNVAQVNDEERRLLNEFGPELAVIKGRVDSLESRVGEFEAGMFSTTTKLTGKTNFVVGAIDKETATGESANTTDAAVFVYSTQLDLKSSFTGKDLLYTRIKTGNFTNSQFDEKGGAYLAAANTNDDALQVDKIWYQFPVGDNLEFWVGAKIENYYMLASAPSVYKPILKGFALGGNGATYGSSTGQGFGVAWTQSVDDRSQPRFAVSANYTSGDSTGETADPATGGLFTDGAKQHTLVKVEYGAPRWQASIAYARKDGNYDQGSYFSTTLGQEATGNSDSIAVRGYWIPESTGAIPSISVGYDIRTVDDDCSSTNVTNDSDYCVDEAQSWMVGLGWKDVIIDGNKAGVAFGQRQKMTSGGAGRNDDSADPFQWEAYYSFKVSDNITVTPAVFGITEPTDGTEDDIDLGGLVMTTFKF